MDLCSSSFEASRVFHLHFRQTHVETVLCQTNRSHHVHHKTTRVWAMYWKQIARDNVSE